MAIVSRNLRRWPFRLAACMAFPLALAAADWWRTIDTTPLAELKPAEFANGAVPGWTVLQGKLERVELPEPDAAGADTPGQGAGQVALRAKTAVRLWAGDDTWERYTVTAELKLALARYAYLAAACARDGRQVKVGYEVGVAALKDRPFQLMTRAHDRDGRIPRPNVSSFGRRRDGAERGSRLKPDFAAWTARLRSRNAERAEQRIAAWEREFEDVPDHQHRWFQLRVEITPLQARMWLDGILMASVDRPAWTRGGVSLLLMPGNLIRSVRVETLPAGTDGYLPLDLALLCNSQGIGSDLGDGYAFDADALPAPGRFVEVAGIPFRWTGTPGRLNTLDISKTAYRGEAEYRMTSAEHRDRKRALLRVPRRQYRTLALIAAADTREDSTADLNVRMLKTERGNVLDTCCPIPRWTGATAAAEPAPQAPRQSLQEEAGGRESSRGEASPSHQYVQPDRGHATALPTGRMLRDGKPSVEQGHLWLVRIPLDPGAFQDFLANPDEWHLELDLTTPPKRQGHPPTRKVRAGVHILAATLVESPVQMTVSSGEYGHVFVQPRKPTFEINLANVSPQPRHGTILAQVTDAYGKAHTESTGYALAAGETTIATVPLTVGALGLHDLNVELRDAEGRTLIRRQTTFACIPPDTRQAGDDSPFGMWIFPEAHYGAGAEPGLNLMSGIGVHWAHGFFPDPPPPEYGIRRAYYSALHRRGTPDELVENLKSMPDIKHLSVFGENVIAAAHARLFPPELLETPAPIPLNAEEETTFQEFWEKGISYSRLVREHFPDKTLVFGIGYPQFISTFLSRTFPPEYVDGLGLDFIGDRMNFFYYTRQVAEHYGYHDLPLHIYEGFYTGSDRGYYPDRVLEQRQADVYIQGFLRGLAMGVVRFGASGGIWDCGGWYHWTGYGNCGMCHLPPELNPKPAYVAYGTMTRLLDGATFHSVVPTGSTVACVTRFDRREVPLYAAWTIRGHTQLEFQMNPASAPRLTDSQGNARDLTVNGGTASFPVSTAPVWLQDAGELQSFTAGPVFHYSDLPVRAKPIDTFAAAPAWSLDPAACAEVEALDPSFPVKRAEFALDLGTGRQPDEKALRLRLLHEPGVSPHRFRYAVLRPAADIIVPDGSRQLGIWLRGNGAAWIDLELEDANGARWTTVRTPARYDFGMQYRGPHAFDGWRYVTYPFEPPEQRQSWPNHFHCDDRRARLALPARLTGIIVQQYAKVLHINALVPPSTDTWALGELLVE